MFQRKHSAILSTFIKLPFVIKISLSLFEWLFYTGLTLLYMQGWQAHSWYNSKLMFRPKTMFLALLGTCTCMYKDRLYVHVIRTTCILSKIRKICYIHVLNDFNGKTILSWLKQCFIVLLPNSRNKLIKVKNS